MQHQIGDYNAFMPANQTKTLGNDDQAFWGMAAMSAAENVLPDLPSDQGPSWLALAQAVFNTQAPRWNTEMCGGGLKWQIFTFNNGYTYRNTISNGCFINLGARLFKYTGNTTDSDWVEKTWEWEQRVGLMSQDYHYFDGTDDVKNCTDVNHIQWTYNAGVHMAGAAAMWNATQSDQWRTRLEGVIKGTDVFFKDNVMFEVACETNGKCNTDQRSFKAYLSRWMGYTMLVAPWTKDLLWTRMQTSAQAAAQQCSGGEDGKTCGLRWTNRATWDGSYGVGEQMAAMEIFQNLLIANVSGPVTEKAGGVSKSDPSAGGEAQVQPITFDGITTGDKAGAGFLTTLVLIAIIAGAWWMVA
jgi:mannan endo-1,6-alpha-mannosidase